MKLLGHVFNSESKSVTFAWWLTVSSTVLFACMPDKFTVNHLAAANGIAAGLVGLKSAKEGWAPTEAKPNAATAAA
jgi:hypothetical protein